jgi:hypothetical protein
VTPGQALVTLPGVRFVVEEVRSDGSEAIVRGARLGGRLFAWQEDGGGYWARSATDNGQSGTSLFDSLEPVGHRFRLRAVD